MPFLPTGTRSQYVATRFLPYGQVMPIASNHLTAQRLRTLLSEILAPNTAPGEAFAPDLEPLCRELGLQTARLTLFGEEAGKVREFTAGSDRPSPGGAGVWRTPCRHGAQTFGTLEVQPPPSTPLEEEQRAALGLVADQLATAAHIHALDRAVDTSALEAEAVATARLIRDLRAERDLRDTILAGTPYGVIAVDDGRRVILMNNAARHFFAGSEAPGAQRGNPIERYLPQAPFLERLQRVLGGATELETLDLGEESGPDQHHYLINIFQLRQGDDGGATVIVRDVTRQRKLDEQVLRMGRVASLGQLAAGIAHEIRNPLTGISITLDILREEPGLSGEGQEMISDISREIDRLEALIHGLLDFARPQQAQHRPMRLAKTLDWHRTFREQCRNKGLECTLEMDANPKVAGDPDRLKQLFLNLAINALDATDAGGRVTLRAGVDTAADGVERARVEVSDTGRGMDGQTLEQVFDPFFTTKSEGTGLGLSIAHSIAEQHGGSIEVTSVPGTGSTFRVDLPLHTGKPES